MKAQFFTTTLIALAFSLPAVSATQTQPPVSDPQALALAAQAIAALTSGNVVVDVTLSGNATRIAGSDKETGSTTLLAKGRGESRVDLKLSGGTPSEVRNDSSGYPQGQFVGTDGTIQSWALHNCWINASWFFPALSILAPTSDPAVILTYVGEESRNGAPVQHIQSFRYIDAKHQITTTVAQSVSTMDIYLDFASLLPVAFVFNVHPDDDATTNIGVEIDFSSYEAVDGVQIPFHIQKLISNGLALDIVLSSAVLNSGLPDSYFAIQ